MIVHSLVKRYIRDNQVHEIFYVMRQVMITINCLIHIGRINEQIAILNWYFINIKLIFDIFTWDMQKCYANILLIIFCPVFEFKTFQICSPKHKVQDFLFRWFWLSRWNLSKSKRQNSSNPKIDALVTADYSS